VLRKTLIFTALLVPTYLAVVSVFWIVRNTSGFSFTSIVILYIWVFGLCGVVGLIRSLLDSTSNTQLGIRTNIILLGAGIVSTVVTLAALNFWSPIASARAWSNPRVWLILLVFPIMPVAVALLETKRLNSKLRKLSAVEPSRIGLLWVGILSLPLVLTVSRAMVEEAVMYWYGHDFLEVVTPAAERVAKGAPFCIFSDYQYVPSFEALNKREILSRAIRQNIRYVRTDATSWRKPHFRIVVGDRAYWWSFKKQSFAYISGHEWSRVPLGGCPTSGD